MWVIKNASRCNCTLGCFNILIVLGAIVYSRQTQRSLLYVFLDIITIAAVVMLIYLPFRIIGLEDVGFPLALGIAVDLGTFFGKNKRK